MPRKNSLPPLHQLQQDDTRWVGYMGSCCWCQIATLPFVSLSRNHQTRLRLTVQLSSFGEPQLSVLGWQTLSGFMPQHHQATTVGPLSKALNPICSRGAVWWPTVGSDPSFLTSCYIWWKEFNCAISYMWQIKVAFLLCVKIPDQQLFKKILFCALHCCISRHTGVPNKMLSECHSWRIEWIELTQTKPKNVCLIQFCIRCVCNLGIFVCSYVQIVWFDVVTFFISFILAGSWLVRLNWILFSK